MEIKVKIKNVYGNELIYPACDKSKLFAHIAGTVTLTPESLSLISQLGYQVKQIVQTPADSFLNRINATNSTIQ